MAIERLLATNFSWPVKVFGRGVSLWTKDRELCPKPQQNFTNWKSSFHYRIPPNRIVRWQCSRLVSANCLVHIDATILSTM